MFLLVREREIKKEKEKNMLKYVELRKYIEEKYGKVLENYEEDYGRNGMDRLWGCESREEVDELLGDYLE